MGINNKLKEKRKGSNITGIVLIRIAAFAFAIVSWKATADGLSKYVFESDWQSGLVSFAIQTILFVFNLKLPFYFAKIGELAPDREKKKYRFGTNQVSPLLQLRKAISSGWGLACIRRSANSF